jgi:hypothetical protein
MNFCFTGLIQNSKITGILNLQDLRRISEAPKGFKNGNKPHKAGRGMA